MTCSSVAALVLGVASAPLNIGFVDGAIVTDGPPPTGACPSEGTAETLAIVGTIVTQSGATFSTAGNVTIATLDGRVGSLAPAITMVNAVITVPADATP